MLNREQLKLALTLQTQSYHLLKWLAGGVGKGFIPAPRAHEYGNLSDSALDWIQEHYLNLPEKARPQKEHLNEFAKFFSTYLSSSFDLVERPEMHLRSYDGCWCPWCTYLVEAPRLQPKKLKKRDKEQALQLMRDRLNELAKEEQFVVRASRIESILENPECHLASAYSTYGSWLIKRTRGLTAGKSILALWRKFAWTPQGSPKKNFTLELKSITDAEELLIRKI